MPLPSFLRWLSASPLSQAAATRISEQINPTAIASSPTQEDWYWGRLATGGEEDYYWHRLSDNWYMKDVIPSTYLELHNTCYEAYNANPLAFAVVEITTSFVLGKGLVISAHEQQAQQVLMRFWNDPSNHMDSRIYDLCTELSLYGEQFIRFFVNAYDGRVQVRQIDPSLIDQIDCDPEDIETPLRFHRRPIGPSDLATLLPWLRRYKEWLTDRVRINKYKGAFLWKCSSAEQTKRR